MNTSVLAHSGSDPSEAELVVCHATGFCKETLAPVVAELDALAARPLRTTLLDLRGHGESTPHPGPFDWDSITDDVLHVLSGRTDPIVGVGHSLGGAVVARAEIKRPGTFRHLVLIEPIAFPGPFRATDIPLSVGAEKRRRVFASRDAAYERFGRGPFADWDRRALTNYVDHGFHQTEDGWALRCLPEVEAEVFRQGSNVDTWDHLHEIRCPVTVVVGEDSDTHRDPYLSMLVDRFHEPVVEVLSGLGHLSPMQDPARVAAAVAEALERG